MYNLEDYILPNGLSLVVSLMMVSGASYLGSYFIKLSGLPLNELKWLKFQEPIFGLALISSLIYPLALFSFLTYEILIGISLIILITGVIYSAKILTKIYNKHYISKDVLTPNKFLVSTVILLYLSYFLFSIGPTTNADSIDYHIGVAISIINNGSMPISPEWFHSRLAGSGEVLNALGLIIGAEQFGSLMQFFGLVGIGSIIYFSNENSNSLNNKGWKLTLLLALLCSPIFIFLTGSAKPQLLPLSMTSLAMILLVNSSSHNYCKKTKLINFGLICLFVMSSVQLKFVYLLGGGLIGITAYLLMIKEKYFLQSTLIGTLLFVLIMFPAMLWKINFYDSSLIESVLSAFPGNLPGYVNFDNMHRNYSDGPLPFPLYLLIPQSFGKLTMIIGLGIFLCLFIKKPDKLNLKIIFLLSFIVLIIMAIFGPNTSRHFLEPFVWMLIGLSIQGPAKININKIKFLNFSMLIQSIGVLVMLWYGIFTNIPGTFSKSYRENILINNANGYEVMKWANKNLKGESVILVPNRSMSFSKNKLLSMDWMEYTELDNKSPLLYLNKIKSNKATHILIFENNYEESKTYNLFKECITSNALGPKKNYLATRNPYNRKRNKDAWILEFNSENLPDCYLKGF